MESTENQVEKSQEFKTGFEEGFHKGIIQGYIKGHTDANEELKVQKEQNFVSKILDMIVKLLKESVFLNTPMSSLINAIRSLIKALPQLFLPNQIKLGTVS